MATNVKVVYGTRTDKTANFTGVATLASGGYVVQGDSTDISTTGFADLLVDLSTTNSIAPAGGNNQVVVFAMASTDGTNYTAGGVASSTTEPTLTLVGVMPQNGTTANRKVLSVASAFGGVLPPHLKLVIKNDSANALSAATIHTQSVTVSTATA